LNTESGTAARLRDEVMGPDGSLDTKPFGDRLSLGVAARLSCYLQVLT
jgi:hypothetical protein